MNEIGFIGAGKMAKAIITGIFNSADNFNFKSKREDAILHVEEHAIEL